MAEKVERKTQAETGVDQATLDAYYDELDRQAEAAETKAPPPRAQPAQTKAQAPAEDKAQPAPTAANRAARPKP